MKLVLFFIIVLIAGCAYTSKTTMNAQAGKLVSPYGVLTNGTMNVSRTMTWGN